MKKQEQLIELIEYIIRDAVDMLVTDKSGLTLDFYQD